MEQLEMRKREAALRAIDLVTSATTVGLGSGSTARYFVEGLGQRLRDGALRDVTGVPTSDGTEALARRHGIPLTELGEQGVDIDVDGMDEVTPALDAIKGLGGAMAREKIVAAAARRFVLIGDDRKRVTRLGERSPVPVEVLPFGVRRTGQRLRELGARPVLRLLGEHPYRTDNGNLVLDCHFEAPFDPPGLADALGGLPGVVEHGLFLGMAARAFVATATGVLELVPERS
jgi:ribose 5-phosphate isomerase A